MSTLLPLEMARRKYPVLDFSPLPTTCRCRVLFVYPNAQRVHTPQLGIASLSACVKRIGGQTALFDITTLERGTELDGFRQALDAFDPDMVAFSVRSNEWPLTQQMAAHAAERNVLTVAGGPHATYAPDDTIAHVDRVVIGEGEGAIMDLVRAHAMGWDDTDIPNTWHKHNGQVIRNAKRSLIENLDEVPFPDWRLFDDVHYTDSYLKGVAESMDVVAAIEGSRGCPFTCTYCSNERLMRDYKGLGRWRREKSPERLVDELVAFRNTFGDLQFVYWVDEIWLTGAERLAEFRDLYKAAVNVPFSIMERPECITEEKIRIIADAGLHTVAIGLESGDQKPRESLLNRKTSRETLVQAFTLPKRHGVRVHAFTMLGLPEQDEASMVLSWKFMRDIRPDTAQFSIFYPLKGTVLYDQTVSTGLYDPGTEMQDYYSGSPLRQDGISNTTIMRYQYLFQAYATRDGVWASIAFHLARKSSVLFRLLRFLRHMRWIAAASAYSPGPLVREFSRLVGRKLFGTRRVRSAPIACAASES